MTLGLILLLFSMGWAQINSTSHLIKQLSQTNQKSGNLIISITNESHASEQFELRLRQTYLTKQGLAIRSWYGAALNDVSRSIHISNSGKNIVAHIANSKFSFQLYSNKDSYQWSQLSSKPGLRDGCQIIDLSTNYKETNKSAANSDLLIYDVALTATPQFSATHGNTTTEVLMSIMGYLNQINTIYERELGIHLALAPGSEKLIFLSGQNDPFSNQIGQAVVQNIQILQDSIGISNYDIGHLLRAGGGGLANIEVACTPNKGFGVSGFENAANFHLLLAHEIGHQIGAGHTWNSCSNTLNGIQRSPSSAMEPGSGNTVMSYAGLCGANNVSNVREPYFHSISIEQIQKFTRTGIGATCPQITSEPNTPPSILQVTSTEKAIPKNTPFILSGSAFDAEGDALTHAWDQTDQDGAVNLGTQTSFNPIIRSRAPTVNPERYIPDLVNLANGVEDQSELLPSTNRNLEFRYVVRDNHPSNGNLSWTQFSLQTDTSAGPFIIKEDPAVSWFAEGIHLVKWDVANTDNTAVDCQFVDILIDYEGLLGFNDTLAHQIPNDGLHFITLPDTISTNARIMVKSSDNIFFDISDAPFQINRIVQGDFQIFSDTTRRTICNESEIHYKISSVPRNGFINPIRYSLGLLPDGITGSFSDNDLLPGQEVIVTINIDASIERKEYSIPIDAFAVNGTSQRIDFSLHLQNQNLNVPILLSPSEGQVLNSSSEYTWQSDRSSSKNIIEIANNPTFDSGSILVKDSTSQNQTVLSQLPAGTYFWRVINLNSCSPPSSSAILPFGIKSSFCNTAINTSPKVISLGIDSISSTINVATDNAIQSITLSNIKGSHSYVGDLNFVLVAPNGQRFELVNNECNESRNFDFNIDASSDRLRCSINRGLSYKPTDSLDPLIGTSSQGNWTLKIIDKIPGDGGQLDGWELNICSFDNPASPITITSDTLKLQPGENADVTSSILESQDEDNSPSEIRYIITTGVTKGFLLNGNDTLRLGDSFTQEEIDNGSLLYKHMNSINEMDELRYIITDSQGATSQIQTLIIDINTDVNTRTLKESFGITIFPNPAENYININIPDKARSEIVLKLYHVNGKQVLQKVIHKLTTSSHLNLNQFPVGVYILNLSSGEKTGSERIILQR